MRQSGLDGFRPYLEGFETLVRVPLRVFLPGSDRTYKGLKPDPAGWPAGRPSTGSDRTYKGLKPFGAQIAILGRLEFRPYL